MEAARDAHELVLALLRALAGDPPQPVLRRQYDEVCDQLGLPPSSDLIRGRPRGWAALCREAGLPGVKTGAGLERASPWTPEALLDVLELYLAERPPATMAAYRPWQRTRPHIRTPPLSLFLVHFGSWAQARAALDARTARMGPGSEDDETH